MNLGSLLDDCYRRLRYTTTPPPETIVRLTAFINDVHQDLLTIPGLQRLRDDTLTITALANQSKTGLPPAVARINGIVDRQNNIKLQQVPLSELRAIDPAQMNVGGYPLRYAVVGQQAVQIQPAATGVPLYASSTSATDTTQKVFIESIHLGAYPPFTTSGVTLTGTTRVFVSQSTDNIEVTRFYLDSRTNGYISLWDAATAGNELARIQPPTLFSRYQAVVWWPIQTVDCLEYADITRTIADLVNPTDEPLIPPDFHSTVIQGVLEREYTRLDDSRASIARADYQQGMADLQSWVMNDGDRIASLRPIPTKWSRLGGDYPADRRWW
jgi:hypothetical protein